jgi:hypothetical protein
LGIKNDWKLLLGYGRGLVVVVHVKLPRDAISKEVIGVFSPSSFLTQFLEAQQQAIHGL